MDEQENDLREQEEPATEKFEKPKFHRDSWIDKLKGALRPLYAKVILSCLVIGLSVYGGLSMCSTAKTALKTRYSIGIDPTWYPLKLWGKERNMTVFCEILLREISKNLGIQVEIILTSTDRLFPDFDRGRYDGVLSTMLPQAVWTGGTPYIVSVPLYRLGPVLVLRPQDSYQSLNDMSGKIVALVGEARTDVNIDHYPGVIFSGYNDISAAFVDLSNKKIDGVIADSLEAKSYAHGLYAGKVVITDFTLTDEGILLILSKSKEAEHFIELFNQELKRLRENGTYAALLKSWQVVAE